MNYNRKYTNADIAAVIEMHVCQFLTVKEIRYKTGFAESMINRSIQMYYGVPRHIENTEILFLQQKESGTE